MREWDTCIRRTTRSCSDSRNDFETNAVLRQLFQFLATATEDERIAPFQATDALTLQRELHQKIVNTFLRDMCIARSLANVDSLSITSSEIDDFIGDQAVIENDIG